jgi:hypothetical protein
VRELLRSAVAWFDRRVAPGETEDASLLLRGRRRSSSIGLRDRDRWDRQPIDGVEVGSKIKADVIRAKHSLRVWHWSRRLQPRVPLVLKIEHGHNQLGSGLRHYESARLCQRRSDNGELDVGRDNSSNGPSCPDISAVSVSEGRLRDVQSSH